MSDTMNKTEIDALNDVTKVLIDSQKGYEKCADVTDENFAFQAEFRRRANDRAGLINRIQQQVRSLGGEPQTEGGTLGALHRTLTEFSSLFQNDAKAALEAVDDGEAHLASAIKDRMDKPEVQGQSRALLQEAYASASEGEAFADRLS
ncbi:PA2169 family four-helix-bundle protein [Hyphomonas atlantica corrig.]|uniref:PA2169 family four-helix-bundle protein n=1 Tax=Hyphomonas atlantica TaxID=1280948 RepID=UPI0023563BC0|nr:PA2169 family four-helix-bundle protein [Hyphomonas atlantica]